MLTDIEVRVERRLLPDECVANYRATGLRPCFGLFEDNMGGACGISTLAVARGHRRSDGHISHTPIMDEFGEDYCWGFIVGFDAKDKAVERELRHMHPGKNFYLGLADGRACREAVLAIDWDAPQVVPISIPQTNLIGDRVPLAVAQ